MAQTNTPQTGPDRSPRSGRGLSILVGVLLILAGGFAIAFPFLMSVATTLVIGWVFVFVGIVTIIHAFSAGGWRGALWNGLVGVVLLIGGGLLIANPLAGTLSLTMLLASILVIEGVFEVFGAIAMRDRPNWGWLLLSGLIALAAGFAIAFNLPGSATWVLGFLVGLDLIFSGVNYIMDPHEHTTRGGDASVPAATA